MAMIQASFGITIGNTQWSAAREEAYMIESGLLDPEQPTIRAHRRYRSTLFAEFSPMDRAMIRSSLGMAKEGS